MQRAGVVFSMCSAFHQVCDPVTHLTPSLYGEHFKCAMNVPDWAATACLMDRLCKYRDNSTISDRNSSVTVMVAIISAPYWKGVCNIKGSHPFFGWCLHKRLSFVFLPPWFLLKPNELVQLSSLFCLLPSPTSLSPRASVSLDGVPLFWSHWPLWLSSLPTVFHLTPYFTAELRLISPQSSEHCSLYCQSTLNYPQLKANANEKNCSVMKLLQKD